MLSLLGFARQVSNSGSTDGHYKRGCKRCHYGCQELFCSSFHIMISFSLCLHIYLTVNYGFFLPSFRAIIISKAIDTTHTIGWIRPAGVMLNRTVLSLVASIFEAFIVLIIN